MDLGAYITRLYSTKWWTAQYNGQSLLQVWSSRAYFPRLYCDRCQRPDGWHGSSYTGSCNCRCTSRCISIPVSSLVSCVLRNLFHCLYYVIFITRFRSFSLFLKPALKASSISPRHRHLITFTTIIKSKKRHRIYHDCISKNPRTFTNGVISVLYQIATACAAVRSNKRNWTKWKEED